MSVVAISYTTRKLLFLGQMVAEEDEVDGKSERERDRERIAVNTDEE